MKLLFQFLIFGLLFSSCQSLQPKFGKICINLEKEKLNYTINSDFSDTFFRQRSIDYFDWYFLDYYNYQMNEKGFSTDARNCAAWYTIKQPAFDIYGLKNKDYVGGNRTFNAKVLYADFAAILSSDKTWFLQAKDSLPEIMTILEIDSNTMLPAWIWYREKEVKRQKNYSYAPEGFNDHHLQNLAYKMATLVAENTDKIITQELKTNKDLIQKIYHPGKK